LGKKREYFKAFGAIHDGIILAGNFMAG